MAIVGLALLTSACVSTSAELAQQAPKYEREIAKPPIDVKSCILGDSPELYTVVERAGGYRMVNASELGGAVMVIDVMPSPTGSHVKAWAPGLFWKSRVDRCA